MSYTLGLYSGFCLKQLKIRLLRWSETPCLITGSSFFIFYISSLSSEHYQGDYLWSISQSTTPKEKISEAKLYSLLYKAYRLMQRGEPRLNCFQPSFYFYIAKPKSPNLHFPSFNKMFQDLMSLCTMPVCLSLDNAHKICLAKIVTNGSGRPCCEVLTNRQRSPPQQNQVIMKQKLVVSKMSLIFIVQFELQAYWHRISFQRRIFYSAVLYTALSTTLTQTNQKVQVSKPTQTSPLIPLPSF